MSASCVHMNPIHYMLESMKIILFVLFASFRLCRESPDPRIGREGRVGTDSPRDKAFFQLQ